MTTSSDTPRLNAKALGELLSLPAYEQLRVLQEYKYPKNRPSVFMTPYYAPALNGIREFFRSGLDRDALTKARAVIDRSKHTVKRRQNHRVVDAFETSHLATRRLSVRPSKRFSIEVRSLEVRLGADLLV